MSSYHGADFSLWSDRVQAVCGALEAVPVRDRPFIGDLQVRRAADLEVVQHRVSIERMHWTSRHVAEARDAYCYFVLQLDGGLRVTQNGQEAVLGPGDCTLIDSLRPVEFHTGGYLNQIVFHMPRELLTSRTLDGDIPCAYAVSGAAGSGAVLSAYARTLFDQAEAPAAGDSRYRESLLALLLAALPGIPDQAERRRDRQLQRIRRFIDDRLADPDLSPALVAENLGLSTRHLHRLFEDCGQSLGEWIRERRLERARADLGDPQQARRSILDIAFGWGFNDASHFSRSFRSRFGLSPREYRRRALARG